MIGAPWQRYASTSMPNGFPEENVELEAKLDALHEAHQPLPYTLHAAEIDDVLSAMEQERAPFISSEDGRRTVELITAIYKAGSTRSPVELPLKADDPFYTAEGIIKNARHFYEKGASVENFTDAGMKNSFGR